MDEREWMILLGLAAWAWSVAAAFRAGQGYEREERELAHNAAMGRLLRPDAELQAAIDAHNAKVAERDAQATAGSSTPG